MMSSALIVVDVQNDFVEGGSLAVAGGVALSERISTFMVSNSRNYEKIIFTRDWHLPWPHPNEGHFAENPDFVNSWPIHCVKNTTGADLVPAISNCLDLFAEIYTINKGEGFHGYSGYEGKTSRGLTMDDLVNPNKVERVDICGIAFDKCVRATALDAVYSGIKTVNVLVDLTVGISRATEFETAVELNKNNVGLLDSTCLF